MSSLTIRQEKFVYLSYKKGIKLFGNNFDNRWGVMGQKCFNY